MDCSSINVIDLQFLTNPTEMMKIYKKDEVEPDIISEKELDFYKIRIFNMAKKILQKKEVDKKIKYSFLDFANICIQHFKFIDASEAIQKDYREISKREKERKQKRKQKTLENKSNLKKEIKKTNLIIAKERKKKENKITDLIKIKKKNENKNKTFIPQKKKLNLSHPKYKVKDLSDKK